jgi:hypothetical protein
MVKLEMVQVYYYQCQIYFMRKIATQKGVDLPEIYAVAMILQEI